MARHVELHNTLLRNAIELYEGYQWTLSFADSRVKSWPLMSSPLPTLYLSLAYLAVVLIGPLIMRCLPAMPFRAPVLLHNIGMACLNAYIALQLLIRTVKLRYNFTCQPVHYANDPDELAIAAALWWYYFSKLLEFGDTFFFIIRKKNSQITFLHVYHHVSMFCLWWIGIKWVAGGSAAFGAMINSFVHVIMYFYYMLTAVGLRPRWKKILTILQLAQFTVAITQTSYSIIWLDCPFPMWMQYALVAYTFSLFVLFMNYWRSEYGQQQQKRKTA